MSGLHEGVGTGETGRRVKELLGRQLELYDRLEQLAEAQRKAIERDETKPLLALLSQRQKLTSGLTDLNAALQPYRVRWEEIARAWPPEERETLNRMHREVEQRLGRILERDEADARLLAAKKSSVAQSIGELTTARRTLAAYSGAGGQPAPVLDGMEA